jgi:hypothetical protein
MSKETTTYIPEGGYHYRIDTDERLLFFHPFGRPEKFFGFNVAFAKTLRESIDRFLEIMEEDECEEFPC